MLATALQAQSIEVPQTQMPLITKRTATWCPLCGTWGWTLFRNLLEDNSDNAVLIAAHHSGDLQNAAASAITANFNAVSQPRFYVNNTDVGATSSNGATVRANVAAQVNAAAQATPAVQTGILALHNQGTLNIYTRTQAFSDVTGEIYLGTYLVEKTVIANQASVGPNAEHKNVLRQSLAGGDFGLQISQSGLTPDSDITAEISLPLGSYDPTNLEIITILWLKEGNTYTAINANKESSVEEGVIQSAGEANNPLAQYVRIAPNLIDATSTITLDLPSSVSAASVRLFSRQGQWVGTLHQGPLPAGTTDIALQRGHLPAGMYVIQFQLAGEQMSRKIVFK